MVRKAHKINLRVTAGNFVIFWQVVFVLFPGVA
jgi:hypothetical protein